MKSVSIRRRAACEVCSRISGLIRFDREATGRAGDNTLTLAGTTQLDPDAGWPTALTLRGDTVRVVQLPDFGAALWLELKPTKSIDHG